MFFGEGLMINIEEYVDRTAELINLPLDPEHCAGFAVTSEDSCDRLTCYRFPLLPEAEVAPVFEP